jgi:hypothetical protein
MAEADAQLGPLLDAFHRRDSAEGWGAHRFLDDGVGDALAAADDGTVRTAALWAHRQLCVGRDMVKSWIVTEMITALARRKLSWTVEEVEWALRLTLVRGEFGSDIGARTRLPVSAAERLPQTELGLLRPRLVQLRRKIDASAAHAPAEDLRRLRRRVDALIGDGGATPSELPPSLLHGGDALGPALRAEMGAELNGPGMPALLVHAAAAPGPRPPDKWRAEGRRLLAAAPHGETAVRRILERALAQPESRVHQKYRGGEPFDHFLWVHDSTARLLRGLLLIAGDLDERWVTPLLGDVLEYAGGGNGGSASAPRDLVVANAAVAALGRRPDAVPRLARAQSRLKHRALLKGVAAALETAAERSGLSLGELVETTVPTSGLDAEGRRTEPLGAYTAVVAVAPPGTVSLSFRTDAGRELGGVPAAVRTEHAERLADLRAEVKDLKKTLAAQRVRVESLLAEERTWTADAWARHYRDHPLVGSLVRGLLWEVGTGNTWRTGLLSGEGSLVDLDAAPLPADGDIRLWHPLRAGAEEVRAWREHLLTAEVRQPFKQAFREIYRLTDAEVATGDHSNRFAAHVLRAPQAQALMRTRGWTGNSLGYWDGGFEGHVTKPYAPGWRAEFFFDLIEEESDDYGTPSLASSDQVRFSRQEGAVWVPWPLVEVPPLIFTEAMRDVDLFVGVTSIAADPTWITRGQRPHETYWQSVSFGALSEAAANRREALERLVPRLRIADRCSLTERFLEVRGDLRTYKIHLGSGNILMSPDDEYLCIVPSRDDRGPTVYLPFEEDGGLLSVILSKAFLLAADSTITDRSITSQITRR